VWGQRGHEERGPIRPRQRRESLILWMSASGTVPSTVQGLLRRCAWRRSEQRWRVGDSRANQRGYVLRCSMPQPLGTPARMGRAVPEVARQPQHHNSGTQLGRALARISVSIVKDTETFQTIMHCLGIRMDPVNRILSRPTARWHRYPPSCAGSRSGAALCSLMFVWCLHGWEYRCRGRCDP
jgi:hypothetical protein